MRGSLYTNCHTITKGMVLSRPETVFNHERAKEATPIKSTAHIESAHIKTVTASVHSKSAAARSRLAASWRRSMLSHGLDPAQADPQEFCTENEVALRRDALGCVMMIAAPKLDRLFELVGNSGCGIALTDRDGIIIDHHFSGADAPIFAGWGLELGAD